MDRSIRTLALQLFGLCGFAIAQPVFDLLGGTPEFLLVRRVDRIDVLLLVAGVSLAPPLLLLLVELAAGVLGSRARTVVHVLLVALLGALCALPAINRAVSLSPAATLGAGAAAGTVLAGIYAMSAGFRSFTTWLGAAGLIFPALFLMRPATMLIIAPPAIELGSAAGGASDAPIVMVVFDEFPLIALTRPDGQIDATLFPNFARLARDTTWFRNATTVGTMTPTAVGSILTGVLQGVAPLGVPATKSKNLFTLLGGTHDLSVRESYAPFCPPSLCRDPGGESRATRERALLYDTAVVWLHAVTPPPWADRLPALAFGSLLLRPEKVMTREEHAATLREGPVKTHWSTTPAQRREAFQGFIDSITPSDRPTLHYFHVLVPHVPYVFEPSGKICADSRRAPIPAWWYHSGDSRVLQQRLLMQVGFVDTMVGRLLDQLERTGLYDDTLLVLVGDHGMSFRPTERRRPLSMANRCDILPVPLFIKAPHQGSGQTIDRNVEVIDVLPTMAAVLGITVPWRLDGHSALDTTHPERKGKIMVGPLWGPESALPWKAGRLTFPTDEGIRCLTSDRPNPDVAWGDGPQRVFRRG